MARRVVFSGFQMGGLSALGMVFDLLSTTFPDTPRILR